MITDDLDACIVRSIAKEERRSICNAVWSSSDLKPIILAKVEKQIKDESSGLCSRSCPSILADPKPQSLIQLKDSEVVKELEERAPLLHRVLNAVASGKYVKKETSKQSEKVSRAVSMASSVLLRCRTPNMSTLAYRLSLLMWHGGAEKQVQHKIMTYIS